MLMCYNCKTFFDNGDLKEIGTGVTVDGHAETYKTVICPYCGSDEVGDAVRCDVCGEWADDYLCDDCRRYIRGRLEAVISEMTQALKADRADVIWGVSEEIEKMK